jgi:hypothetical protein
MFGTWYAQQPDRLIQGASLRVSVATATSSLSGPPAPGCGLGPGLLSERLQSYGRLFCCAAHHRRSPPYPWRRRQAGAGVPSDWPHITHPDELHGMQQLAIDYLGY